VYGVCEGQPASLKQECWVLADAAHSLLRDCYPSILSEAANVHMTLQCAVHRPLKTFIIELVIGWVNHKHKMQVQPG
jgi:hypothetical protein